MTVNYGISVPNNVELAIYDATGSVAKSITRTQLTPGYYREKINIGELSSGVYLCFGQVNWEIEIVDSLLLATGLEYQAALALDTNGSPHIIFNKENYHTLLYAQRISNGVWSKALIDSGSFYACPSFVLDKNNIPHCSYYEAIGQNAYLFYAYKDTAGWHKVSFDTISGILTPYWFSWGDYFRTSIDIDTNNTPGIAYVSFNPADSVFFIKYAYFDGVNWNISVVEYDTGCGSIHQPNDMYPHLAFSSQNVPHIAYHHLIGRTDTIKLAYWNDSLGEWLKDTVYNHSYGCASISFKINNQDEPYIAHGVDVGLYCSYRRDGIWYHEYTGIDIGWLNTSFSLDLDSLSNPHIVYTVMGSPPRYCFQDTIWHNFGDLDTLNSVVRQLLIDHSNQLHLIYKGYAGISAYLKYAKGSFVGIGESDTGYTIQD